MLVDNIDRKSWHYRLATVYAQDDERMMGDSCSYLKSVFRGLLLAMLIAGLAGGTVAGVYSFFFWIIMVGFGEAFAYPTLFFIIGTFTLAIVVILGCMASFTIARYRYMVYRLEKYPNGKIETKSEPGFFRMAKNRLVDKLCTRVEFK